MSLQSTGAWLSVWFRRCKELDESFQPFSFRGEGLPVGECSGSLENRGAMRLGKSWRQDLPKDMQAFLPPPMVNKMETGRMSIAMRKEFLVIAAVIAVALAGYLFWQRAQEGPAMEATTPPAAAPQTTGSQTAPATSPAPATTPAPATPPAAQ